MSSTLYWRPNIIRAAKPLSDELKHVLRSADAFNNTVSGIYTEKNLDYLRGLRDAGIKDAEKLIEAIKKYGEVELMEES